MEEIAQQFHEELQALLDRYKNHLSVPRIMNIAQNVFHKTLSIRYHPELHHVNLKEISGIKVPVEFADSADSAEFKSLDDIKNE